MTKKGYVKLRFLKDFIRKDFTIEKGRIIEVKKKGHRPLVNDGIAEYVEIIKQEEKQDDPLGKIMEESGADRETAWKMQKNREEQEIVEKKWKEQEKTKKEVETKKPITTAAEQKLIRDHYKKPLVKEIIIDHAREGNLWRAFNGDFVEWYRYFKDMAWLFGPMSKAWLLGPTALDDYDYLTANHRTLFWTHNFFDESTQKISIPRSLHDEYKNKLTIGTFADTKTYSLGVDIDSGKGYNIMQAEVREAVEALAQFMCDKFRKTCPTSTYADFSGGGIYIYLHHNLFTEKFKTDKNLNLSWRILVDCFNAYIKDIESQFFEQHPEYKGKAKADAINNQKRVFKTILSIHKDYPFACIPLDVKNIKIDIKKARLPLSDETIDECKNWMKKFDVKERIPLLIELKKYENQCRPFDDDTPARVKVLTTAADRRYWPPCIKKIVASENVPNGATRMKTLYTTFIGQAGYSKDEAEKSFNAVSTKLGGQKTNIFESWFKKMSCPGCKTIQKKGGGFPHMTMGELGICQPDGTCKEITNPIEYSQEKRIESMTIFSLTVRGKVYHIKFESAVRHGKVIYYLMEGKEKGLETEITTDFYRNEGKRKAFYKNIIDAVGETDKRKIEEIKKELADILTQLQKSNILALSDGTMGFKYVNTQKEQSQDEKKAQEETQKEAQDDDVIIETELDEFTKVILTKEGISLDIQMGVNQTTGEEKWLLKKVYVGKFEPKEKLMVDIDRAIKYIIDGEERIDNPVGIVAWMKKDEGIVSKKYIEDCVNAVCLNLPKRRGHATYGVYQNNNKLALCLDSLPLKQAQEIVKIQCKEALNQKITKDTIKPYIELVDRWHPYEILPSMGMGVMAPFALTLRKNNYFIYNIVHFSPVPKLGKSTIHHTYSRYLFNIFPVSGNSIETTFRFSTVLDSICGFISIDEAENVKWKKTTDLLKQSPENYICNIRGTSDQGINRFLSRAVLGINCNRFGITDHSVLVRILKIEFDGTCVSQRGGNSKKVEEIKQIMNKLKPIGWRLVELELEDLKYSFDELSRRLDYHETELKKVYEKFIDPRRVITYASIYEGLQVWQRAAEKYEVKWKAPSYTEFATDVIDKIERSTEEAGELSIHDFIHWWEMFKAKNTRKVYVEGGDSYKEIVGEDIIWTNATLDVSEKSYPGDAITGVILREYKGDKQAKIDSLSDIAKAIEQLTGIPLKSLYKPWKIGGKTQRAVFIPSDIWKFKDGQTKLKDGITSEQKKLKETISVGEQEGLTIDDEFLHDHFDANVMYDAIENGLLIKKNDKEYTWRD